MRNSRTRAIRFLLIAVLSWHLTATAQDAACRGASAVNPIGNDIAEAAIREHREFGGHRIDANGYLTRFGSVESETELLLQAQSGRRAAETPGRFAWRRVWEYWTVLNTRVPGETTGRKIVYVPGLLEDPRTEEPAKELALGTLLPELEKDGNAAGFALRDAAVRAALNDSPWSAAFISYLMHRAGLKDGQFNYSSTHSDYIKTAFDAPAGYAFHPCDPRTTMPRVGDLLCYSRSNPPLENFAAWREAAKAPGFITASHCDAVVSVDVDARKFDTIGGNVLQSVTRRSLKLNEDRVLSRSHRILSPSARQESDCLLRDKCRRQDFNRQHWSVLLRLK